MLSDSDLYALLQSAANIGDASFARVLVGYLKSDRDMVVSQASQASPCLEEAKASRSIHRRISCLSSLGASMSSSA